MVSIPLGSPTGVTQISIAGGENLYRLAELYLGNATQWWRIAELNDFPGEAPDFIISAADSQRLNGTLQIPEVDPNATWP